GTSFDQAAFSGAHTSFDQATFSARRTSFDQAAFSGVRTSFDSPQAWNNVSFDGDRFAKRKER
ncbi:MAG TPA: hypothetical protein VE759_18770, partial [Mycobacterium sp.]|nr:hypothetical protein [Mycobacterium sp.]